MDASGAGDGSAAALSRQSGLAATAGALLRAAGVTDAHAQGKSPGQPEQFVLYFDFASAKLSSAARPVIGDAANAIRRTVDKGNFSHVKVIGYADTVGS